jgi:N6-adenosine-specific RNA methylase IME4
MGANGKGNGNGRAPADEPAPNAADHINGNVNAPYTRADRRGERVLLSGHVAASVREHAAQLAERRGISVGDLLAELLADQPPAVLDPVDAGLDPLPPGPFGTILADPRWRFTNRTGKVAPEHRRLSRYDTLMLDEICAIPVANTAAAQSHLYLWVPNALLAEGLQVMEAWGFAYKSNLVWHKIRRDGGSDGRGVGFYFRNVTELVLFGVRGSLRTLAPGRRQVNLLATRKREHSRKPDDLYPIIEACSPGPRLELFARYPQPGWEVWGNEAPKDVTPRGRQYPAYS